MKQDLWLVNSSLVLVLVCALGAYQLLFQQPPTWRPPKVSSETETEQKKEVKQKSWELIYQDDIFGTYVPREIKAVKQSWVTPIPEPKTPNIPPPPEIKKQEFVPPLTITLRGVIAAGDDTKNVAMIADEANKESMYHLGEKIKDAQIIKIATNRVVLLRANGQQETFYLRKDDQGASDQPPAEKWKQIVKKINDQSFEVDPKSFLKEVESLGKFIQRTSIIGTAFQNGTPVGIRVGKVDPNDIGFALGIMDNDIITTINNLSVADAKNRVKVYDDITEMSLGSDVTVGIKRADKDILLSYKLARIEQQPKKRVFSGVKVAEQVTAGQPKEEQFKQNRLQQREQNIREFSKIHPDAQKHQQTMMEIRRRILENLHNRNQQPS